MRIRFVPLGIQASYLRPEECLTNGRAILQTQGAVSGAFWDVDNISELS